MCLKVSRLLWSLQSYGLDIASFLAQVGRAVFMGANWQSPSLPKSLNPLASTQQPQYEKRHIHKNGSPHGTTGTYWCGLW
jgi:hypothetical protein